MALQNLFHKNKFEKQIHLRNILWQLKFLPSQTSNMPATVYLYILSTRLNKPR